MAMPIAARDDADVSLALDLTRQIAAAPVAVQNNCGRSRAAPAARPRPVFLSLCLDRGLISLIFCDNLSLL
jgi:hypothetical protein